MSEKFEHSIELSGGFNDKENKSHTRVVFGKRLTTKDLIDLDNDPQAANPTQYNDLIRRKMIVKFGDLKMPATLNALLSLDSIDREDLAAAADKFVQASRGETIGEMREDGEVKLRFGFDIDGTTYNVVRFGKLTTGKDEMEADALGSGVARQCFLIGRQITSLSTDDGLARIEGAVAPDKFNALDAEDFNQLRMGELLWRNSFRLKRTGVSVERDGGDGVYSGAGDAIVGSGDSESADGAD